MQMQIYFDDSIILNEVELYYCTYILEPCY